MRTWCQILPFFIVVWIARRYEERWTIWLGQGEHPREAVSPYKGVYFYTTDEMERLKAKEEDCK